MHNIGLSHLQILQQMQRKESLQKQKEKELKQAAQGSCCLDVVFCCQQYFIVDCFVNKALFDTVFKQLMFKVDAIPTLEGHEPEPLFHISALYWQLACTCILSCV